MEPVEPEVPAPTTAPETTEEITIPVGETSSPTAAEENGSNYSSSSDFWWAVTLCSFTGLLGLIPLCFIKDERKKKAYHKGAIIGLIISIVVDVILIVIFTQLRK